MSAMTAEKSEKAEKMTKIMSGFGMSRMRRKATLSDVRRVLGKKDTIQDPESETDDEKMPTEQACQVIVRCRPSQVGRYGKVCTFAAEAAGMDRFMLTLEPPENEPGVKKPRPFRCHRFFPADVDQEEVFEEGEWVVDRTMEGLNTTVLCHGITGSGKSHTMWGAMTPSTSSAAEPSEKDLGFAHMVSHSIFAYIRDQSFTGEVFAVEAQFLEIASDGMKDRLFDLLASEEKPLEIKPDPYNAGSFVCDGLSSWPIRSPDEMVAVLSRGLEKSKELEASSGVEAARSHLALMIGVENLKESTSPRGEPVIQKGKLVLVDLPGSESLKHVQVRKGTSDQTLQRQAIAINRVLAGLASAVSATSDSNGTEREKAAGNYRDSPLTLLLKDCVGENARVMLIAHVSPEFDLMEETRKTLTYAQQMIAAKDHAIPTGHKINREQSSLAKMRGRHQECIRILHEKAIDTTEQQRAERARLQAEFEDLNRRLLTAENASSSLEDMKIEQLKKIDEIRQEVTSTMSQEMSSLRKQSVQDMDTLRKSLTEEKAQEIGKVLKNHDEKMKAMMEEMEELKMAKRKVEDEVTQYRMKLAASEQELKWVQNREAELKRENVDGQEEKKDLKVQAEQLWQKLSVNESDLLRVKAEAEMQRAEVARLQDERDDLRERESGGQRQALQLQRELEEARREAQLMEVRRQSEQREMQSLQMQVQQLDKLRAQVEKLEEDRDACRHREEDMKEQFAEELHAYQVEVDEAKQREQELMHLLNEVQESIMVAAEGA